MKNVKSFRLFFCILAAFIILFTGIESAHAATINVTANATDTLNGADSQCSLREAITNINDGALTYADCPNTGAAYGTSDIINIPAGTYTTLIGTYTISKSLSIVGAGAGTTTIDGGGLGRVFYITGAYTVSISGVTIQHGSTANYGGGIAIWSGTLTVANATITSNTAGIEGGAIYNWFATATVTNSTISSNTANGGWGGGGIFNVGPLTVTNSTITGNTATNSTAGGGIFQGGSGGALTVINSTISGNSASTGGGIHTNGDQVTLSNAIVANQTGGADCSGSITSTGHNLESGTSCGFTGAGDLQNANPLLGALAENGGLTQTMALQPGSPAIDAGDNAICAAAPVNGVDQRSYSRPAGAACDIGAFESAASCVTPPRSGLVAWWSGQNNANDSAGTNTGTPINGVTYSGGHLGNAFDLNGTNQAIAVPDGIIPQTARYFTVGAWVNANSMAAGTHMIFYGGANAGEFMLILDSGHFVFQPDLASSSWQTVTSPVLSTTGTWYYVAGVRRGTSIEIWVNGILMASTSIPDENLQYASWNPTGFPSRIGAYHHDVNGDQGFFNGKIDEVTLYNRALSASELEWTYRGTCDVPDMVPDAFTFTAQTGMPLSTVIVSNPITVTGINSPAAISISGGEYAVSSDGGSTWSAYSTAIPATLSLNDQVKVRQTSSASYSTLTTATLTIGTVSGTFDVTTAASGDPNASGLVSWWKAENNAYDSVGGNHGTLQHGATFAPGKYGQAFSFDGVDDAVSVGMLNNTALNENMPFSISAWINSSNTAPSQSIAGNYMGEPPQGDQNFSSYLRIYNGNIDFGVAKRQVASVDLSTPISTGWHPVTFTYDGSVLKLYLDGEMKSSGTRNFSGSTDNTRGWYIGNFSPETNSVHGYNSSFNGLIDDVAVYNRALTAVEVSALAGTLPNAFSFTAPTGVALSTVVESSAVMVTGISFPTPVSIAGEGAEYSILASGGSNWSAWTALVGMVNPGDSVKVRQTSAASLSTTTTAVLTIGGVSGTFSVTTVALKGNINTDETVTLADAILALQIIGGMNPFGIRNNYASSGADVKDDGKIGLEEAIYILQTLSGLR